MYDIKWHKFKGFLENKQIKGESGKIAKPMQKLEFIMDVWNVIVNFSTEESYINFFMQLKNVGTKYSIFLNMFKLQFILGEEENNVCMDGSS